MEWKGPMFRYLALNEQDREDLQAFSAFSEKKNIEAAKTYLEIVCHKKDHWLVYLLNNCALYRTTPKDFNDPFDCMVVIDSQVKDKDLLTWLRIYAVNQLFDREIWAKLIINKIGSEKTKEYLCNENIESCPLEHRLLFIEVIQKTLESIAYRSRTICFSENPDSILMWAHYSDKHEGYCLGFNSIELNASDLRADFYKIDYGSKEESDYRPRITLSFEDLRDFKFIKNLYLSKSRHWEHEKEIRMIHFKPEEYYIFNPISLKRIILGAKMPENHKKGFQFLVYVLVESLSHVVFSYADLDKNEFKVNILDRPKGL